MALIWIALITILYLALFRSSSNELEWAGEVPFSANELNFVIIVSRYVDDSTYYVNRVRIVRPSGNVEETSYAPKSASLKKFCKVMEIGYESLFAIVCNHSGGFSSRQGYVIPPAVLAAILSNRD